MSAIPKEQCLHLPQTAGEVPIETAACAECAIESPTRVCLTCGYVGCCDSANGHATAHANETNHPAIRSLPVSASSFTWCYQCNSYLT